MIAFSILYYVIFLLEVWNKGENIDFCSRSFFCLSLSEKKPEVCRTYRSGNSFLCLKSFANGGPIRPRSAHFSGMSAVSIFNFRPGQITRGAFDSHGAHASSATSSSGGHASDKKFVNREFNKWDEKRGHSVHYAVWNRIRDKSARIIIRGRGSGGLASVLRARTICERQKKLRAGSESKIRSRKCRVVRRAGFLLLDWLQPHSAV